jgi:transposase
MSKGKRIYMIQIRDVIHRLRNKKSQRCVSRETGIDRSLVKKIYELATVNHWLDSTSPIPNDEEIAKVWNVKAKKQNHILDDYYDELKQWHNAGYTAVVMQNLLKDKCSCDIQAIRRYLSSHFPKPIEPIMVRPTFPGEDMDVDFGYLGRFLDERNVEKKTWIFSARLRHSRKAYREVVVNQKAATFFACHVHAFEYFNGVSKNIILDNTKAAIIQSTKDNDMVSRSYQEMAEHYGFIINPCLPRTPEHKGGVEGDMKYVKINFLPFFHEKQKDKGIKRSTICDLAEALEKWGREVADVHIIHGVGRSPLEIFKTEEEKILRPLPNKRWELTSWSQCTVRRDWRIMHESAYYSVPYRLIEKTVQVCATNSFIRIFYDHQEVAFHEIAKEKWEYKRKTEHAPPLKEEVLQCSREGLLLQAEKIGSFTYRVAFEILSHPSVDKLRPVRCLLKLGNKYSQDRLEKACQRACTYKMFSYQNVKNILENNLELEPAETPNTSKVVPFSNYRFARNSSDYKSANYNARETFEEKLMRIHPVSKHGNAMMGVWEGLLADQHIEEENKL